MRIGDIFTVNPRNNVSDDTIVSFVPMTLVDDGFSNRFTYQERPWGKVKSGFTHFQEGDVGLAKITPCLENRKSAVFTGLSNGFGAGTTELHIFRPVIGESILALYLLWFFKSEQFISGCIGAFAGAVGQQRVGKDYVANTAMPIPPLAEQLRIVAAIESAFAVIDEIERNKTDLQTAVAAAKSKILSLAIRGKLVPQDPADEPASALLERIRAEREALIKAGKIKRLPAGQAGGKGDSVIVRGDDNSYYEKIGGKTVCIDEQIPFDVPEGWTWARLGEITNIIMGQSPSGDSVTDNPNGLEFHQGKIYFTDRYLKHSGQYTSETNKVAVKHSVLLCVRAPVGIVNITDRKIAIGRGLCALDPLADMSVEFLYHWLTAFQNNFIEQATGTTFIAITMDVVRQQLVPIPPIAEQIKLIGAVERGFLHLKEIAENLN